MRRYLMGILILLACAVPALAAAQQANVTLDEAAAQLSLSQVQKDRIRELGDQARDRQQRLSAQIQSAEAELKRTLEDANADEATVEAQVLKLASLEGENRAARLVAWVKIRKVLNVEQRAALEQMQGKKGGVHAKVSEFSIQGKRLTIVITAGSQQGLKLGSRGVFDAVPGSSIEVIQVTADEATCGVRGVTTDQLENARDVTVWP